MVSHRHAAANNPFMDDYDALRPLSYLLYLDCNNLYGAAMSEALPTGGFEWVRNFVYSSVRKLTEAPVSTQQLLSEYYNYCYSSLMSDIEHLCVLG